MNLNASESMTIGHLARAASVDVETIRYYLRRGLLPVPSSSGAFWQYPVALAARIHFVKHAQELGFSLVEITELLRLEDGADRDSIRSIATDRLSQIEKKLDALKKMQRTLRHLVTECEYTDGNDLCPIIASLVQAGQASKNAPLVDSSVSCASRTNS